MESQAITRSKRPYIVADTAPCNFLGSVHSENHIHCVSGLLNMHCDSGRSPWSQQGDGCKEFTKDLLCGTAGNPLCSFHGQMSPFLQMFMFTACPSGHLPLPRLGGWHCRFVTEVLHIQVLGFTCGDINCRGLFFQPNHRLQGKLVPHNARRIFYNV